MIHGEKRYPHPVLCVAGRIRYDPAEDGTVSLSESLSVSAEDGHRRLYHKSRPAGAEGNLDPAPACRQQHKPDSQTSQPNTARI